MEVSYAQELERSGKIVFTVKGVSMRPLFRADTDAILVVKCDPETLKNWDIVLFLRPGPKGIVTTAQRRGKPIKMSGFGYSLYMNLWIKPYRFRFVVLTVKWKLRSIASRILRPFRHRSK